MRRPATDSEAQAALPAPDANLSAEAQADLEWLEMFDPKDEDGERFQIVVARIRAALQRLDAYELGEQPRVREALDEAIRIADALVEEEHRRSSAPVYYAAAVLKQRLRAMRDQKAVT